MKAAAISILMTLVFAEFAEEVRGKDTLIGCYLRDYYDINDGRCQ